ncbi:MAG: hypothetical protein HYS13_22230 [Planctomycetia bacterium]|nr:hypothetical protein [Planctomycetia bacterium]
MPLRRRLPTILLPTILLVGAALTNWLTAAEFPSIDPPPPPAPMPPPSHVSLLRESVSPESAREAAVDVLSCGFETRHDQNFDGWPDGWARQRGRGFPAYLPIGLREISCPEGKSCLGMDLDGGAAAVFSPLVDVARQFEYAVHVRARTEGLVRDRVFLSARFLDERGQPLAVYFSRGIGETSDWTELSVAAIAPPPGARSLSVGLHLQPGGPGDSPERGVPLALPDLKGSAWFDEVVVRRLPRVTLDVYDPKSALSEPSPNLLISPHDVELVARLEGWPAGRFMARLELFDPRGNLLGEPHEKEITTTAAEEAPSAPAPGVAAPRALESVSLHEPASHDRGGTPAPDAESKPAEEPPSAVAPAPPVVVAWRPAAKGPGYYTLRCRVFQIAAAASAASRNESRTLVAEKETSYAIAQHERPVGTGGFGWSLPAVPRDVPLKTFSALAIEGGVQWLKIPAWSIADDQQKLADLHEVALRLAAMDVQLVGVASPPPESVRKEMSLDSDPTAAQLLSADAKAWQPSLDRTVGDLAWYIRQWQLAADRDGSLVRRKDLPNFVDALLRRWAGSGASVRVGVVAPQALAAPAEWRVPMLEMKQSPWSFVSYPPAAEASAAPSTESHEHDGSTRHFAAVRPLPPGQHTTDARAADLVLQMVSAVIDGADAVFLADPLDAASGIVRADGTPGELFVPWRTTALALHGAGFAGTIELPGGSENRVFVRQGKAILVVWSREPHEESIYLGETASLVDAWGAMKPLALRDGEHAFTVGPLPLFILGVDEPITRMRLAATFAQTAMPARVGARLSNRLSFPSLLPDGVSATVRLVLPETWKGRPTKWRMDLKQGESADLPFDLVVPQHADTGPQRIKIDLELDGSGKHITIFRTLQFGETDVTPDLTTEIGPEGELRVTQRLRNSTGQKLAFRCHLYVPGRPRESATVAVMAAAEHTFELPDAASLKGATLWLRSVEVGGGRVISRRFTVP